jgi:hypothetical protein
VKATRNLRCFFGNWVAGGVEPASNRRVSASSVPGDLNPIVLTHPSIGISPIRSEPGISLVFVC